jgi:hypothetical protein
VFGLSILAPSVSRAQEPRVYVQKIAEEHGSDAVHGFMGSWTRAMPYGARTYTIDGKPNEVLVQTGYLPVYERFGLSGDQKERAEAGSPDDLRRAQDGAALLNRLGVPTIKILEIAKVQDAYGWTHPAYVVSNFQYTEDLSPSEARSTLAAMDPTYDGLSGDARTRFKSYAHLDTTLADLTKIEDGLKAARQAGYSVALGHFMIQRDGHVVMTAPQGNVWPEQTSRLSDADRTRLQAQDDRVLGQARNEIKAVQDIAAILQREHLVNDQAHANELAATVAGDAASYDPDPPSPATDEHIRSVTDEIVSALPPMQRHEGDATPWKKVFGSLGSHLDNAASAGMTHPVEDLSQQDP